MIRRLIWMTRDNTPVYFRCIRVIAVLMSCRQRATSARASLVAPSMAVDASTDEGYYSRGILFEESAPNGHAENRSNNSEDPSPSSVSQHIPPNVRVILNVGGVRFETHSSTLRNIPDTRLAWLVETEATSRNGDQFDPRTGEYFFDRHPGAFGMILNYYRTGRLHCPLDVCGPMFEEELAYWGIDEKQIEPCCWTTYCTFREAQATLTQLYGADDDDEMSRDDDPLSGLAPQLSSADRKMMLSQEHNEMVEIAKAFGVEEPWHTPDKFSTWRVIQRKVWGLLEKPRAMGFAGKVMSTLSLVITLASIMIVALGTMPSLREILKLNDTSAVLRHNLSLFPNRLPVDTALRQRYPRVVDFMQLTRPKDTLLNIDHGFTAFFTLELLLRLLCCPRRRAYWTNMLNWIDIVALACAYFSIMLSHMDVSNSHAILQQILTLPRIFRIFKLTRHMSGLKILVHTMKASGMELLLLLVVFTIFVLLYGNLVFICEQINEEEANSFINVPYGCWWALVTMATVGFGDLFPVTPCGYLIGVMCVMSGVLVIALPVPIIVNNFALFYTQAQARLKLPKRKRCALVGVPASLRGEIFTMNGNVISTAAVAFAGEKGKETVEMEVKRTAITATESASASSSISVRENKVANHRQDRIHDKKPMFEGSDPICLVDLEGFDFIPVSRDFESKSAEDFRPDFNRPLRNAMAKFLPVTTTIPEMGDES